MNAEAVGRLIDRALGKIRQPFRGELGTRKHRTGAANLVQFGGLEGESLPQMEMIQHAGFTSGVPAGADVVALPLGGKTKHIIVIASEAGNCKVAVGDGEAAMYHITEPDLHIWLRSGGVVEIKGATKVLADAPLVEATGDVLVRGNLHVEGNVTTDSNIVAQGDISDHNNKSMAGMRGIYNSHNHPENDHGGPTAQPNQQMGGG